MHLADDGIFAFLLNYAAYASLSGMWFAYLGGVSPWWGAVIGLGMVFLVGLPTHLLRRRSRSRAASRSRF